MDSTRLDDDETDMVDEVSAESVATIEAPAPVAEAPAPAETEVAVEEVEAPATETVAKSFADELLKAVADSDPLKAELVAKAINKEAQRLKDEWAGREAGWIKRTDRKKYAENPKLWEDDQRKLAEFDRMRAEVETLRKTPATPNPEGTQAKPTPPAEKSGLDKAKEFVAKNNIDESQTPLIAALFDEMRAEMPKVQAAPVVNVRQELATLQWEKEKLEAEADEDFKSNNSLRKLAWANSQYEGMPPAKALAEAKIAMGIKPKTVIKLVGKTQVGQSAFAKPGGTKPTAVVSYDGKTDPLSVLKKKYSIDDD